MSYATLEHYQWQMPKDKNTTDTSTFKSWTCSSGGTYAYYNNSADKPDSCDPNCTGYCSPICTGPTTPGAAATPDKLVCNNVDNWRTVTCIPDDGLGGGSVDPRKAKCGLEFSHGPGPAPTFSDCQKMMSQLQNTLDDEGNPLLAPGATCSENITGLYDYLIWGCEEPGGTCT